MNKRFRVLTVAALGTMLVLAGCSSGAPSTTPETSSSAPAAVSGGNVNVVVPDEPRSLYSGIDNNAGAGSIAALVVDGLVATDPDGNPIPGLVDSWERVEGNDLEWIFNLREDIEFTNGEKFDAAAAVFAIETIRDGEGARAGHVEQLASAEVTGDYQFQVTTKDPIGFAPELLHLVEAVPPVAYAAMAIEDWGRAPIGTGAFILDEWVPGQEMKFSKNPTYWGTEANVDTVTIQWNSEPDSRIAMLQTGQADIIKDIPSQLIPSVESTGSAVVESTEGTSVWTLQPNWHVAPFDDIRVRQALAHAIDRDAIVQGVFGGRGATAHQNFWPSSYLGSGTYPDMLTFDPEQAKSLLAEVGDIVPVEFYWNTEHNQFGQAVSAMLEDVGFTVNQHPMERGAFFELLLKDEMPGMHVIGVNAAYPHESYSLNSFVFPTSVVTYCANDELVEEAAAALNTVGDERARAYQAIEHQILVDSVCPVPVYTSDVTWGISTSTIEDWVPRADGNYDFSNTVVKR